MDTIARALLDKVLAQVQRLAPPPRPAARPAARRALSTGFADLDRVLGGGLPLGQITELAGQPTSGARTVALQTLAGAQSAGALGAYVDLGGSFDPGYAQACGVSIADLLLVRPHSPVETLGLIETLTFSGAAVVVVDSLTEIAGFSRPGLSWWSLVRRLRPALADTSCAVLALSSRYPHAEEALASLRLVFRRGEWLMASGKMSDFQTRVLVQRPSSGRQRQVLLTIPLTGALPGL